jgi:hypothetical protein
MNPLYFVEQQHKNGRAFAELDRDRSSLEQVIQDILGGQYTNVVTVLEVFEDEGTVRNITEDVTREVFKRAKPDMDIDGIPTFGHLNDLFQEHVGIRETEEAAHS